MRVAVLVPSSVLEPQVHELGPPRTIRSLCAALAAVKGLDLLAMRVRVTPSEKQYVELGGLRGVRCWIGHIGEVFREFRPDILHTFSTTATGLAGLRIASVARSHGARWVDSVLGLIKLENRFGYPHRPQSILFERVRLRGSDCTVFPSEFAMHAARSLRARECTQMSRMIPLGVEDAWFAQGTWRSERGDAPFSRELDIVSVGAIAPHKGQDILLKAFQLANVSGCVRMIGPEINHRYAVGLKELVSRLGESKEVAFTGFLSQAETMTALKSANVFALLSRFDLYSQAVIEAMALGHAPIVSRSVGASEQIENGTSGYVVDDDASDQVAQTLEAIAANLPEHRRRGDRARSLAEKLRWSKVAEDYAELYKEVVRTEPNVGA